MAFVQPTDPFPDPEPTVRGPSSGTVDHVRVTRGAALYGPKRTVSPEMAEPKWWQRLARWMVNNLR